MSENSQSEARTVPVQNRVLIRWIWRDYLKQHWLKIIIALVLMAIEGSMLGALSYMVQPMFDTVFIAGDRNAVYWVAGAIAGIFIVRACADFGHRILMYGAGLSVITRMQRDMVNHLLTLDSAFFHTNPPGTLTYHTGAMTGTTSAGGGIGVAIDTSGATPKLWVENRLGSGQSVSLTFVGGL